MITKMLDETNERNTQRTITLAKHFFLCEADEKLLENCIQDPPYPHEFPRELMNTHHRLFIEVPKDENLDAEWKKLQSTLRDILPTLSQENLSVLLRLSYKDWLKGRLPDGQKLFKWLGHFVPQSTIEELTTNRNTNNNYLVISKNPMDWLFMSTGQSFRSCMSLESDYRNAYYLGTPLYMVNSCYFLIYLTTGKVKSYTIKDQEFKHFRYLARNISVWDPTQKALGLSRYYPFCPSPAFHDTPAPIKITADTWQADTNTRFFKTLSLKNGTEVEPYYDFSFLDGVPCAGGAWGSCFNLDWSGGFNALTDLDKPESDEHLRCENCGELVHEDYAYSDNRGEYAYCEECFYDLFSTCDRCDETTERDEQIYIVDRDVNWCHYCADNYAYRCHHCGDYVLNPHHVGHNNNPVCKHCLEEYYTFCDNCESYHDTINTTQDDFNLCDSCYENKTYECDKCGEVFYNETNLTETTDADVCQECLDLSYKHCSICDEYYPLEDQSDVDSVCKYCVDDIMEASA